MATLANLSSRLDRLEQQIEHTAPPGRHYLLFVRLGEDEAIDRQKRELGVADEDDYIVVCFIKTRSGLNGVDET